MKSIKNQYIDLKEGRISQAYFMRNMRMSLPQYVTNVTSFKDTVKILKNKGILSEADIKYKDGKDMYDQFSEIDNLNGQEVLAGTAIEHSCYPDKTKDEILKMVVKNLKKNPFYYTDYKLSGIAGAEPTTGDNTKAADNQMKPVAKDNAVDKALGMKAVKGFENAKASANKASKESNKGENVEMMTLIAKTVRGLVKMDATGEKIKKIVVREAQEATQTFDDHEEWMAAVKAAYPKADYAKGSNKITTRTGEIDAPYEKFFQGFQTFGDWNDKTGIGKLYNYTSDISVNVYPKGSRMDELLNEGPLGTQLLRKADAALKAGQTVTVLGTPIMKIVVPAGALFPADGGPSFRLNNLENPLEDILVDGNEIELDLPAPQAPYVDTRTPEEKAKEERDWANRYGPGGGYDTPMGRRTFDEGMGDTLTQAQQYIASNPTLKAADIKLQKSGDDVILSYNSYSTLSPEVADALGKQFDFEEDQVDGGGEDKDKIYYTLSPKHTTPNVGVGLQSMEEMIRKVVREMFDGMEPLDRTGMDA